MFNKQGKKMTSIDKFTTTSFGLFLFRHFPECSVEELANKFHANLPYFTDWISGSVVPPNLAVHMILHDFAIGKKEVYRALHTNLISISAKLLDVNLEQIEEWDSELINNRKVNQG